MTAADAAHFAPLDRHTSRGAGLERIGRRRWAPGVIVDSFLRVHGSSIRLRREAAEKPAIFPFLPTQEMRYIRGDREEEIGGWCTC